MKQVIIGLFASLVILAPLTQAESLSRERQQEIIETFRYVTGRSTEVPDQMAAESELTVDGHPIVKCGMSAVADFVLNRQYMDRDLLASMGLQTQLRPTYVNEKTLVSPLGLFKVHFSTDDPNHSVPTTTNDGDTIPDYVQATAVILDSVHTAIVDGLGYPKPPSDGFYPSGGDSLYDVYLKDIGSGVYGLTWLDSAQIDGPGSIRATSWMELDRNYDGLPQYADRPLDAIRVTAAHEYFHAVQFAIDFTEAAIYTEGGFTVVARYWMEMSAVWMEEQLYDGINDYYNYLPYFFNDPRLSLQQFRNAFNDLRPYANGIFPMFLDEQFGPDIIRSIWLRCGAGGFGDDFLFVANQAIDSATGGGEDWATTVQEFAIWNWFTGPRASLAPSGVGYPERDTFPAFPDSMINGIKNYPTTQLANSNFFNPLHNGASYVTFEDLFLIEYDTLYWGCQEYLDSTCVDSTQVFDPLAGYDFIHFGATIQDTTYWNCGSWSDSVCSQWRQVGPLSVRDYMLIVPNDTGGLDTTYYRCLEKDTIRCIDSVRVEADGAYDWVDIDSVFNLTMSLGIQKDSVLPQPWGVTFILRPESGVDPVEIDRLQIADKTTASIQVFEPDTYRRITMVLTPASYSNSSRFYRSFPASRPMDYGFFVEADVPLEQYANKPNAVLAPYPNPAVLARMGGEPLRFRMQVQTDAVAEPLYAQPYMVVDIFTVAGERIATISEATAEPARGLYELAWDLRTDRGEEVASGAYIAYARLYDTSRKLELLAEDHVKIAVIR